MELTEHRPVNAIQLAILVFLSWLGAYIHTTMELALPIWRPENSIPAAVGLALFLGWWRQPQQRRLWIWLLLAWTAVAHLLIGAVLSVLPVPMWPFYPQQSLAHYLSHVVYGAAQLPLIWVLGQEVWCWWKATPGG